MKLALYIRSVRTSRGAEQVVVAVARGLAARGHTVDLVVEERSGWLLEECAAHEPRVNVVDLAGATDGWLPRRLAQSRALADVLVASGAWPGAGTDFVAPLLRLLRRDDPPLDALLRYADVARPDAIVASLSYPCTVLGLLAPRLRPSLRRVLWIHNHLSVAAARSESRWAQSVPVLMRRLLREADTIVGVSAGVAEDLRTLAGPAAARVRMIHNPGYRAELAARAAEPSGHPWLDAAGPPVVLGVGKLKPQKDFPTLLRAFAALRRGRPARLVILGEGALESELRSLAKQLGVADDVDFAGFVRNPYPLYARAAALAHAAAWEGFGNVLVEALACGCPVVSTDCPSGPREILEGGRFGRLVPVGDAEALAGALAATLDDPPPRAMLRERASAFSLERALDAWERLLAEPRAAREQRAVVTGRDDARTVAP